jgi:hypothetical protein
MTIAEIYKEAKDHYSLRLLIDYLVHEKQVLKMTDNESQLTYYLQDKYWAKMGEYLRKCEEEREWTAK